MKRRYNPDLIPNAKSLRKNMTEVEKKLWFLFLRQYPVRFVRQKVLGEYIVDFFCFEAKLAIELDGSQHYEDAGREYDERRTAYIEEYGVLVLRIPNNEVNRNFRGVCERIDSLVKERIGEIPPQPHRR